MGKAERNRQQNARQRIALQQAAARKAEARRRMVVAGGSALAVVVIVVGLIVVKTVTSSSAKVNTSVSSNQTVAKQLTTVPATVLDKVGPGPTSGANEVAPLKPISSPALTLNGKPEMLYIGAEYCPYCAAERWAMVEALSRFGTFKNLGFIHSTSNDVYSNTSTLTFYKSSYTSKYISFKPLETFTVDNKPLQQASTAENALLQKYGQGSFPFVDIDGKYVVSGAQYLPSVLGTTSTQDPTHFGLTWSQIGKDLQNPNSPVTQAIIGAANHITAAICNVTNDQPSNVCKSTSVTSVGGNI
jgi:thiol-disulfide isomerase/thioredoxin